MSDRAFTLLTGFGGRSFEIACSSREACRLAEFLCADFPGAGSGPEPKRYDLVRAGSAPMLSLWDGDKRLYFGRSPYRLAEVLLNEIVYHCIDSNRDSHALHAGAVAGGQGCLILPGVSGAGKSTLTAWLLTRGFTYLSDELVFLSDDGTVTPLTRPISLKGDGARFPWLPAGRDSEQVISSPEGTIVAHRLLNSDFSSRRPRLTHIVFPRFSAGAPTELRPLTPARSCLRLLQSHANARNLGGLGVARLAAVVRSCRSFSLTYGSFAGLEELFDPARPLSDDARSTA